MLEIIISAIYVFGVATYIASSGTEAISSFIGFRSTLLFRSVETLLNDKITNLAKAIYGNPLVHPRATENDPDALRKDLPSYIDSRNFALALITALKLKQADLDSLRQSSPVIDIERIDEWVRTNVEPLREDGRLRGLLAGAIQRSNFDLATITNGIAQWYEQASQRIAGEYKRWTQLSNFLIALVIAVAFDLSPLPPAVSDLTQASVVPGAAAVAVNGTAASAIPTAPVVVVPPQAIPQAAQPATDAAASPSAANAPNGQTNGNGNGAAKVNGWDWSYVWSFGRKMLGWLVIATSTLLGAPFWFGILSTVANIKSAGAAPATQAQAAAQSGSPPQGSDGGTSSPDTPTQPGGGTPPQTPGGGAAQPTPGAAPVQNATAPAAAGAVAPPSPQGPPQGAAEGSPQGGASPAPGGGTPPA